MQDYQAILNDIYSTLSRAEYKGKVASYIPELSHVNDANFGVSLNLINGKSYTVGNSESLFSIQSISKVFAVSKAFSILGGAIWERLGVEPSGNPFNYLSLLEQENGIPRNPLINSGAIVIADILVSNLENPKQDFLNYIIELTGDNSINYNEAVARSEKVTGFKNIAIANLLKSFNNLENDVDVVLDFYFHQCAIEMSCSQLSKAFHLFANHGKCMKNNEHITSSQTKRINAIMLTCGFYDEAGDFAFDVGLAGKSGVGGGIVAVLPNVYTISVWSPGLNKKGNSLLGMKALELFTSKTGLSIF